MAQGAASPERLAERPNMASGGDRLVTRTRLLHKLRAARDHTVVLLTAPAGYGKSTLLGQWRSDDDRPFAGLAVEHRHNDPVLLVSSLVAALERIEPVDPALHTALDSVRPDLDQIVIPRLVDAIRSRDRPFVLALDDVHLLRGEAATVLAALAEAIPAGSGLALASREEPALPLGRLRARRLLAELRAADLAMTTDEAAELVRLAGTELSDDAVAVLTRRTEGWPAGLYLSTLSLRASADAERDAELFAGDDRLVTDYVRDELLARMAAGDRGFMIRTAVLDELEGAACDALIDGTGSGARLRRLSRSNLLLVPLDGRDQRFRCHALLRETLLAELRRRGADEEAGLHRRAARVLAADDIERAIGHAIAAGDPLLAGELIWPITSDYASRGREATLRMWTEALGPRSIAGSPELCLTAATLAMSGGDGAGVEHWTGFILDPRSEPIEGSLTALARILRAAAAARGPLRDSREELVAAARKLEETSPWTSLCRLIEGSTLWLSGQTRLAVERLEDGARRGARETPSVEALCRSQLALIDLDEGDVTAAGDQIDRVLADHRLYGLHQAPAHALVFAATALVRAVQGRSDEASRELRMAASLLDRLRDFNQWYETETRIVLARASLLLDDAAGCRRLLADAEGGLEAVADAAVLQAWVERSRLEAEAGAAGERWPLTPAELRLLHRLPTHLSFREIADELYVSLNTVKTQTGSIYRKLGVSSRTEAVACARTAGLLGEGPGGAAAGPGSPGRGDAGAPGARQDGRR
ncbi:MAG: LuxR C-terminal-related transcriptional regulator [Solirubrobacterales bacterium]